MAHTEEQSASQVASGAPFRLERYGKFSGEKVGDSKHLSSFVAAEHSFDAVAVSCPMVASGPVGLLATHHAHAFQKGERLSLIHISE
ncbi:hypothetical protein, partial [Streptomyces sp. NPDC057363]|uniref:hypothetical protein n=1 Tax=Streptomyces sp. NPDC057363 TaxID=3346107 RepID=UPI0036283AB5